MLGRTRSLLALGLSLAISGTHAQANQGFGKVRAFQEQLSFYTSEAGQKHLSAFLPELGNAGTDGASLDGRIDAEVTRRGGGGGMLGQGPAGGNGAGGGGASSNGGAGAGAGGNGGAGAGGNGSAPAEGPGGEGINESSRFARAHLVGFMQFGIALSSYMYLRLAAEVSAGRLSQAEMEEIIWEMFTSPEMYAAYLGFVGLHEAGAAAASRIPGYGRGIARAERFLKLARGRVKLITRLKVAGHQNILMMIAMAGTEMIMGSADCLMQCPWERRANEQQDEDEATTIERQMFDVRHRLVAKLKSRGELDADTTFPADSVSPEQFASVARVGRYTEYRQLVVLSRQLADAEQRIGRRARGEAHGCPSGRNLAVSFMANVARDPFTTLGQAWTAVSNGVARVDLVETLITGSAFIAGASLASFVPYLGQSGVFNMFVGFLCAELADRFVVSSYRQWKRSLARDRALAKLTRQYNLVLARKDGSWIGADSDLNAEIQRTEGRDLPPPPTQTRRQQEREEDRRAASIANDCQNAETPSDPFVEPLWEVQEALSKDRGEELQEYRKAFEALSLLSRGKLTRELTQLAKGESWGWTGFTVSFNTSGRWTRLEKVLEVSAEKVEEAADALLSTISTQRRLLARALPPLAALHSGRLRGTVQRFTEDSRALAQVRETQQGSLQSGIRMSRTLREVAVEMTNIGRNEVAGERTSFQGHPVRQERGGQLVSFAAHQYMSLAREEGEVRYGKGRIAEALKQARIFLARVVQHRASNIKADLEGRKDELIGLFDEVDLRHNIQDLYFDDATQGMVNLRNYVKDAFGHEPVNIDRRTVGAQMRAVARLIERWEAAEEDGNTEEAAALLSQIRARQPEAIYSYIRKYVRLESFLFYENGQLIDSDLQKKAHWALTRFVEQTIWRKLNPKRDLNAIRDDLSAVRATLDDYFDAQRAARKLREHLGRDFPAPGDEVSYVENFDVRKAEYDKVMNKILELRTDAAASSQAKNAAVEKALEALDEVFGFVGQPTTVPRNRGSLQDLLGGENPFSSLPQADRDALMQWVLGNRNGGHGSESSTPEVPEEVAAGSQPSQPSQPEAPASTQGGGLFGQGGPAVAPADAPPASEGAPGGETPAWAQGFGDDGFGFDEGAGPQEAPAQQAPPENLTSHEVFEPLLTLVVAQNDPRTNPFLVRERQAFAGKERSPTQLYALPEKPELPEGFGRPQGNMLDTLGGRFPGMGSQPDRGPDLDFDDRFVNPNRILLGTPCNVCHATTRGIYNGTLDQSGRPLDPTRGLGSLFIDRNNPYRMMDKAEFQNLDRYLREAWFLWWDLDQAIKEEEKARERLSDVDELSREADRLAQQLRLGPYELPELQAGGVGPQ